MKRILMLALSLLMLMPAVFAQNTNRSTIRVRLSDGSPMMMTINGRDFKKIGRSLTVGDIPKKRQDIQVYRYRAYADGKGGKAELVYSGRIKLVKGSTYDCIVDLGTGKFRMREVRDLQPLATQPQFNPRQSQPVARNDNYGGEVQATDPSAPGENIDLAMPPDHSVSTRLQALKTNMDKVDADSKKLALAQNFINANKVTSEEVKSIAGWIFFDDNRMTFVKSAFSKVTDRKNFKVVGDVFTLDDSKRAFQDFLQKN